MDKFLPRVTLCVVTVTIVVGGRTWAAEEKTKSADTTLHAKGRIAELRLADKQPSRRSLTR